MITDWLLIRRLALELERDVRGARVQDAGALPDGRIALALWSHRGTVLLCAALFSSPPVVTLEDGELPIAAEPGFVRAAGAALRGTTLTAVRARAGDRVLEAVFGVRSRFGVVAESTLIFELVPRFGNALLCRNGTIVAALREFSLAENGTRSVLAGHAYEPPPIDERLRVPRLIARSYAPAEAAAIVERFGAQDAPLDELFVYRRDGVAVQAHVVALAGFDDAACSREPSLLGVFVEERRAGIARGAYEGVRQRRASLLKTLDERERRLRGELASLEAQRVRIAERDGLRGRGEAIFATLHELDASARNEAKAEAAKLFARYKKLGAALPHVERRDAHVRDALEAVAELRWEVERAADADLADAADAVASLDARRQKAGARAAQRGGTARKRRAPLEYRTPSGSRVLVGRTPLENAELTFRVARPSDLWFHAQGQPGAHVILQRGDRTPPPDGDLTFAASLAAAHSKARRSGAVAVDYTQRKHVRKRPNGAPGLVFYTDFSTLVVAPSAIGEGAEA